MTNTALKAQIDSQITNETTSNGITPTEVGVNIKAVVDYVDQQVISYIYAATLSQSGTSAPVNTSTKNNTGITFTWSRTTVGEYLLTASSSLSAFTCITFLSIGNFRTNQFIVTRIGDTFRVRTYDGSLVPIVLTDDLLNNCNLKIEFYA